MCSVFGVIALAQTDPVEILKWFALLAANNQHRGSEWHGIAHSNGRHLGIEKRTGLVSASLGDRELMVKIMATEPQMMLGQTRFSTTGASTSVNAQPLYLLLREGTVAIGTNGDTPGYERVREFLEGLRSEFLGKNDAEALLHYILFHAQTNLDRIPQGITCLMRQLPAAYSAWLSTRNRIHLFRDPWANHPLFWMRVGNLFFFSSEDCALYAIVAQLVEEGKFDGAVDINQVLPGEIVTVDLHSKSTFTQAVPPREKLACCAFEWVYLDRPDSHLWVPTDGQRLCYQLEVSNGKSEDRVLLFKPSSGIEQIGTLRYDTGKVLGTEHPASGEGCVIAVPASGNKAAEGYAHVTGLPFRIGLVSNPYAGRTFIAPGAENRQHQSMLKYHPLRGLFQGHSHVHAVDDSIVFGTSSQRVVRMMRTAGAQSIDLRIACPPVQHACKTGIDMSSKGELVAAGDRPVDEIRQRIGADSLGYLSLEGLKGVIGPELAPHCCFYCWDGCERIC